MGKPCWGIGYSSNPDKGIDLAGVFFLPYLTAYKSVPSLVRREWCSCRIRSFEAVQCSCILPIGSQPQGNMYLQYCSSCALIETKVSIRLCMLQKGVNLFGSLSKITKQRPSGVHPGNAICNMPPKMASVLLFRLLMTLKQLTAGLGTVYWGKGNNLLG